MEPVPPKEKAKSSGRTKMGKKKETHGFHHESLCLFFERGSVRNKNADYTEPRDNYIIAQPKYFRNTFRCKNFRFFVKQGDISNVSGDIYFQTVDRQKVEQDAIDTPLCKRLRIE